MVACPPVPLPFRIPLSFDRPFDVCCLGLNSIDLVAVVAAFPEANGKQPLELFATLPGGQMGSDRSGSGTAHAAKTDVDHRQATVFAKPSILIQPRLQTGI